MEYEKRQRLIALCDSMKEYGYLDGVEELKSIFPELKESEDEQILKSIADCVSLMGEDGNVFSTHNVTKVQVLSWLEKQKINTEGDFGRGYDCGYEACLNSHGAEWFEKQKEQKPILEVFGFKVGDAVRLKDGDGRKHIIKSFEEVEGLHGPNFYRVEFEDNSAVDSIYPSEKYPNGYYTQMEKFEEEQKPVEPSGKLSRQDYLYQLLIDQLITYSDYEYLIGQKPAEWSEEDSDNLERVDNYIWMLDNYVGDDCAIPQKKADKIRGNIQEVLSPWLKNLPERFNLQPKQEWSEEDEKPFTDVLSALKYAFEDLTDKKSFDSAKDVKEAFDWMQARFKALHE